MKGVRKVNKKFRDTIL